MAIYKCDKCEEEEFDKAPYCKCERQYHRERLSPEDTYVPLNDYEGNEDQWKKCWLGVCDSPNNGNK